MHTYVQGVPDCLCEDAADHAPCLECGGSSGASIHVGDNFVETISLEASDTASGSEMAF